MEKIRSELSKAVMNMKTYYQHILAAVLVIAAVLIVYGRDLEILMNEALQSEAFSHILLIPFFAGYLFYLKKDMVKASLALKRNQKKTKAQHVDAVIGIALCLIAFLVYWYGSYTFYPLEYHLISLPIFVLGITLILFNLKVLTILIFPILFLLFLTPPPTEFMYSIGGFLANFNTQASYTLLKTAGLPVELISTYGSPTLILTTSAGEPARFAIDLACSGIYSMIAFAMFAAFLALITSTSILKKIGLFALGFLLLQILNIFRITIIISIAYWFGEQIAMLIFHSITGLLLIFFGMLLTLFVAEKFLKIQILPGRQAQTTCSKCKGKLQNLQDFCTNCGRFLSNRHPKISQKFWIKLVLLPLCCSLVVLSIQAPTFAIAKGPIEVTSGWESATEIFPSKLECQDINYTLIGFTRYADFENIANQDAALAYTYFPDNRSKAVVYALVNVASSISNLHSWEVCLITWQTSHGQFPVVTTIDSRDVQLLPDVSIIARYLVFDSPQNYTQVTLYWYEKATFNTGITVEQKYVRISLIILRQNSTDYQLYEEQLLNFGQTIASYWEPLKMQSLISLGIPAQQLLLTFSIAFVALTKTAQYSNEWRKKSNNLKIFDKFASADEKFVLQTILDLTKENKAMETKDINFAIKRKKGKYMKFDRLLTILSQLEEHRFIKRDVASIRNKPKLIWKTSH